MTKFLPALSTSEPDPALLEKLAPLRRLCLLAACALASLILAAWFISPLAGLLPPGWDVMRAETALALVLTAISLELSEPRYSVRYNKAGQLLAVLVALFAAAVLIEFAFHISIGFDTLLPCDQGTGDRFPGRPAPQTAGGLLLLGISVVLIPAKNRIAIWTADLVAISLSLLVLTLASGEFFNALRIFSFSTRIHTSQQTLACLFLLTVVALLRRAERGILSIFLGRGIGAATARILGPILILLPIFREVFRARIINAHIISEHYVTAILTSIATMLSMILLLALVWRINSMEMEIRDLSLRDGLTGLYNLKGFTFLAEQALRMAQRSQLPVSVLFVDLDNLKRINDTLGHEAGSSVLVETARLLQATFRETDVIGRIGGDEFAVICQGSHVAISIAAERLTLASRTQSSESGRQYPLSLSLGYVTAEEHARQSLKELLTAADQAMYEEKRRKKLGRTQTA
ncbi:MAG: GGDEF domain-containing protein [Terracidiphilus sp.]|jgi:diguanylate cyclase (GGDEF)-like protein